MLEDVKIINKDSAYCGQRGKLVDEEEVFGVEFRELLMKFRRRCGSENGYLIQLPDGEELFFGPREAEFIN